MVQSGVASETGDANTNLSSAEDVEPSVPAAGETAEHPPAAAKKRKKRKPKKKTDTAEANRAAQSIEQAPKSPVLCISRNKHWRYISSYHGPWLQLPVELLESLLSLNLEPGAFSANDSRPRNSPNSTSDKSKNHISPGNDDPNSIPTHCQSEPPLSESTTPIPPPVDPGVFRSVTSIRRYIDEASDLAVRAASGLSAVALGAVRGGGSSASYSNPSPWATAQSLGINPFNDPAGNGRNVSMSATRIHRLRALAVSRLAAAYRTDEIAASVMVMQGASALDDIAERVLKIEPHNIDARYVHFFHEKIPSRQLAECTTTGVLDDLIRSHPHVLEYYRTRGIVQCFRDEYQLAIRDFTYALKEGRTLRKSRHVHSADGAEDFMSTRRTGKTRKGKKKTTAKTNGRAPPDGTAALEEDEEGVPAVHPSLLADAPTALEHQLLFLRGAAHLQGAIHQIEQTVLELEGVSKGSAQDGAEIRLCYLDNGQYGGVEIGNPDGPLGHIQSKKAIKYRSVLGAPDMREKIGGHLKKSIRDHEKFLSHFDTFSHSCSFTGEGVCRTEAEEAELAYLISETARSQQGSTPRHHTDTSASSFTTYHPLLVESHFSILLCVMLLGQFEMLMSAFTKTATLVDNLEGYPIFLPARSMAQAEFVEVLERLAAGWRVGAAVGGEPEGEMGKRLRSLRTMLGPVLKRQRERAEMALSGEKKKGPINIPLHGPRVEIILAWLGATHLPEMAEAAGLGS